MNRCVSIAAMLLTGCAVGPPVQKSAVSAPTDPSVSKQTSALPG
jgi:hypothetical protein